jgi:aminoglycoside phosphotransferase (APT) family kinase protein
VAGAAASYHPHVEDGELPGIVPGRIERWLAARLPSGRGPYEFRLIAAGGSNLTFAVTDADGHRYALRRPPVGRTLATAHDVRREWKVLSGLHEGDTGVPVPEPLALCEDEAVTGAPFYVMAFAEGTILRTAEDAARLRPDALRAAARSLLDTQIALHAVDPGAVGLDDLGPATGYVERQLERWRRQYDDDHVRRVYLLEELHHRLARTVPPEGPRLGVLHGDYRFDNVVLDADGQVTAVLDWELCTLGDPAADACWSLLYWADPPDEETFLTSSPTTAPGLPSRLEMVGRYSALSGRPLDHWLWFEVFGWWKMACIVEGVHARRSRGLDAGAPTGPLQAIADRADRFLHVADQKARALNL